MRHRKQHQRSKNRSERRREFKPRRFEPSKVLIGRVQKNPRGFAFILPEDKTQRDAYVSEFDARTLLDGDRVEYQVRHEGRRQYANIRKVLERGASSMFGRLERRGKHWALVTPRNDEFFVESSETALHDGDFALARIVKYPIPQAPGSVEIDETLGAELSPAHDNVIGIARYNLPYHFSDSVLQDAQNQEKRFEEELKNPQEPRKDLTHLPFVTVDGEDAKDFDDAILVEEHTGKTAFVLYVAIADVSFFVPTHSPLDKEARNRGTSVYLPGTCIPMLPEKLSNDLCSLRPEQPRLTFTVEIHYDGNTDVIDTQIYPSIIRTQRRMTYKELQDFFDEKPTSFPKLHPALDAANKLYRRLLKKRKHRGVLDFDLPESKIILDAKGNPKEVCKAQHWDSHRLIEEFMIAANSAVAKQAREAKLPALYRVHGTPEVDKIEEINLMLKSLGLSSRIVEIAPRHFAKVLEETGSLRGAKTLHQMILRAQKQADYQHEPKGHFGLALKDYAHFTSPIRRYPDLVVHRALKHRIISSKAKRQSADKYKDSSDFESLGELCSRRERRAMEAERFVVRRKQCWYFKERLGQEFSGIVCGLIERGLFVELDGLAAEGFVPVTELDGYYQFDPKRLLFRKRPGHSVISLGDAMKVIVESVDVEEGTITLHPV